MRIAGAELKTKKFHTEITEGTEGGMSSRNTFRVAVHAPASFESPYPSLCVLSALCVRFLLLSFQFGRLMLCLTESRLSAC